MNAEKENDGEDVMDDGFVSTRCEEADQVDEKNNAWWEERLSRDISPISSAEALRLLKDEKG